MKKLLTAFLSVVLMGLIVSPVPILAADIMDSSTYEEQLSHDAYEDDFIITDHTITGLSATGQSKESIIIPDTVYTIGANAFKNATFKSVIIPDSVTSIGNDAFKGCSNITEIIIPSSVTKLNRGAFYNCSNLYKVDIRSTQLEDVSYGDGVFEGTNITALTLSSQITYLPTWLFKNAGFVNYDLIIPASVQSIGANCFSGCSGLDSVTFQGNSLTSIGNDAFKGCSNITEITIPSSVTKLNRGAFYNCSNLHKVDIRSTQLEDVSYGDGVFEGTNITALTLSSQITYLPTWLFKNAGFVNYDLIIPASVQSIGANCFSGCIGLNSILFPLSIEKIGDEAFKGCTRLQEVVYDGTLSAWNQITIGKNNDPINPPTKFNNKEKEGGTDVAVTGVSLDKSTLSVAKGKTATLTATVAPSDATNKNVTWSTSDSSVATVNNGTVTGVMAGKATITVKTEDGGKTATCAVTVTEEEQGSSFTIMKDSNHFDNREAEFYSGNYGHNNYQFKNSNYYSKLESLKPDMKGYVQSSVIDKWKGSCFGIASTLGLVYTGRLSLNDLTNSNVANYHSLKAPVNDAKLFDSINFYQVGYQLFRDAIIAETYKGDTATPLENYLKKLVESTKNGNTVILTYFSPNSGHSILALNSEYDENNKQYIVTVYDENTAAGTGNDETEHTSEFIISSDFKSFSYRTSHGAQLETEYTSLYIHDLTKFSLLDGISGNSGNSGSASAKYQNKENISDIPEIMFDADNRVTLSLPMKTDTEIVNSKGETLTLKKGIISGTMPVYDKLYISADDASRIEAIVDRDENFTITSGLLDATIIDKDKIMSVKGEKIGTAKILLSDKKIEMENSGNDYSFEGYITSDSDALMSLSGSASGDTIISLAGNTITASSTGTITDASSTTYSGNDTKTETVSGSGTGKVEASHESSDSITITPTSATIEVGKTITLTAKTSQTGATVTWSSSNTNVATVNNGVVTGVSAGSAVITATANGVSATATITVVEHTIGPDYYIEKGKKTKIDVGSKVKKVTVSDKSIAKATKKGKKIVVKGKNAGTVTVTAYGKKNKELGSWIIQVE